MLGILTALVLGCGGKAVVDGVAEGAGGEDGSGGYGICATPDPVGVVSRCGGTVTPQGCSVDTCDQGGQRWRSTCTATGCACEQDPSGTVCSCIGVDWAAFCGGTGHSCCPPPFP